MNIKILLFFLTCASLFANDFFEINGIKYEFNIDDIRFEEIDSNIAVVKYYGTVGGPRWNIYEFAGADYSILKFNYEWYSIITYIFENKNILVNNLFRVGDTYNSIINKLGKPNRERDLFIKGNKILQYGNLFYGRFNRSVSKIEFIIDDNNEVSKIHFNIIGMNIPDNLNNIIIKIPKCCNRISIFSHSVYFIHFIYMFISIKF